MSCSAASTLPPSSSRIGDVLDEPQQAEQSRVTATYSLTYSLPAVPNDIQFSIERQQSGQYFKARSRVVQWLYHDLCLYIMYPGKLYNEAAQALVSRYPNLADASGTGYDSSREALRFKAKSERRKIRIQQNDGATAPDREDEESIAGHIEGMKSEVQRARPDMAYIIDCMRRTLPTRRKWIGCEDPSVEVAIQKFPALAMSSNDTAAVHYIPTVVHRGGILTTSDFSVCLEKICVKETSLLAALATQMALYWAFNIAFDKKAQRSFDLLCRLINVDSGLRPTQLW
ncbi:uncharacterized protein LOC144134097 [Amblyomma americanum]